MGLITYLFLLLGYVFVHLLYGVVLVYLYHTQYNTCRRNTILPLIYINSPILSLKLENRDPTFP